MKTEKLLLGLLLIAFFWSCNRADDGTSITIEEATINSKIDEMNEDVSTIIENEELKTNTNSTQKNNLEQAASSTTCAIISRVPFIGLPLTIGQQVTKTIDYGTSNCQLNSGNFVRGKIILNYEYNPDANTRIITIDFQDFYHNDINYSGSQTMTRTLSVPNSNGVTHPIVSNNINVTATFTDGSMYTRVGTRTREFTNGFSSSGESDNVYTVTGNWTTTFPNTSELVTTITTPLKVKIACYSANKTAIVTGIVTYERGQHVGTLNYGNGVCDNLATFTYNGEIFNVVLRN